MHAGQLFSHKFVNAASLWLCPLRVSVVVRPLLLSEKRRNEFLRRRRENVQIPPSLARFPLDSLSPALSLSPSLSLSGPKIRLIST